MRKKHKMSTICDIFCPRYDGKWFLLDLGYKLLLKVVSGDYMSGIHAAPHDGRAWIHNLTAPASSYHVLASGHYSYV